MDTEDINSDSFDVSDFSKYCERFEDLGTTGWSSTERSLQTDAIIDSAKRTE